VLRAWGPDDVQALLSYACDPLWARFLPVPQPYAERDAQRYIGAARMLRDPLRGGSWAIEWRGSAVGSVDIDLQFEQRVGTLSYSLARSLWGQGLSSEAVRAVIDACFGAIPHLVRIAATTDARNTASIRVLEKIGMQSEGRLRLNSFLRGELADELCYAMLRPEWEAATGAAH